MRRVFGNNTQLSEDELQDMWAIVSFNGGEKLMHKLLTYMNDRYGVTASCIAVSYSG